MSAWIEKLSTYPLTGGPATEHLDVLLGLGGGLNVTDRMWVVYDSSIDPLTDKNRVSLKGPKGKTYPQFTRINAHVEDEQLILTLRDDETEGIKLDVEDQAGDLLVNEFDELTECVDCGPKAASFFARVLELPTARLAQKNVDWVTGDSGPDFKDRKVASVHVVTRSELDSIQPDERRFRPNIVLGGDISAEELYSARHLRIGEAIGETILDLDRDTVRCLVTEMHPDTGEKSKGVLSALSRQKREVNGRPENVLGRYGHFDTATTSWNWPMIRQGDSVTIID